MNGQIIVDCASFSDARSTHQVYLSAEQRKFDPALNEHENMPEDELIMCNAEVRGFSLVERRWGLFLVESISDIQFDAHAFASLILDKEQKDMVLSLVKIHSRDDIGFDDVIKGKGKGMVFLLHGEPGLGKTLTVGESNHTIIMSEMH